MLGVLWGSVYVYDFLYKIQFINENTYLNFIETSKVLKGRAIYNFTSSLWKSSFIHTWVKPDSVSETEFFQEKKIFQKSISLKSNTFSNLKENIQDELDNIGDLAQYINNKKDSSDLKTTNSSAPYRNETKIGRNDPCPCGSGKKYKKCCLNK
jgi:SEC-C motif